MQLPREKWGGGEDWKFGISRCDLWASPVAQQPKNLPAMQETQVQFLGREDAVEKETATHSSILSWEITWTEETGRLQYMGLQESDIT